MRTITDQLREEDADLEENDSFYWNPDRLGRLRPARRTLQVLPDLDTDDGDTVPDEAKEVLG